MKNLFLFNLTITLLFTSNSFAQSQNLEDELFKLRNEPLTPSDSPTQIMRDIEDLNDQYINYRQAALSNLSKPEHLERGREIAETIGLEVVRRRNTLLLHAHVLRLRQKIEQIEDALQSDSYPRLWMRQADQLVLDSSRERLATIEQILTSTETPNSGILDAAITDLSAFISEHRADISHQDRTLIQAFDQDKPESRPDSRIRMKLKGDFTANGSTNTSVNDIFHQLNLLFDRIRQHPESRARWTNYLHEEIEELRPSSLIEVREKGLSITDLEDAAKNVSSKANDSLNLERNMQTLQTLEEEALLLKRALMMMYAEVSVSPYEFVRENTLLLANLFELDGNYSTLTTLQKLIESPENLATKQRVESLRTELIKVVSLIPHTPENTTSLASSCLNTPAPANTKISSLDMTFLEALNISPTSPRTASANDLSFMFLKPTLQGNSLSCVAHSVASDMEFEINKTNHGQVDIDEEYTYLKLQHRFYSWHHPISIEVKDTLSQGNWNDQEDYSDRGVVSDLNLNVLRPRQTFRSDSPSPYTDTSGVLAEIEPGDHQGERQKVIDRLRNKPRYAVQAYIHYIDPWQHRRRRRRVDCSFIRLLIDNQQPPIITLSSNARKLSGEGWLHIPPMNTGIQHTALIVGYGEGIDPRDMIKKPYFILRDSFVDEPIHYKVAADELLPQIRNLHKITQVVHLNPTPSAL